MPLPRKYLVLTAMVCVSFISFLSTKHQVANESPETYKDKAKRHDNSADEQGSDLINSSFEEKRKAWNQRVDLFIGETEHPPILLPEEAKLYSNRPYLKVKNLTNEELLNEDITEDVPLAHFDSEDIKEAGEKKVPIYSPSSAARKELSPAIRQKFIDRKLLLRKQCGKPTKFSASSEGLQFIGSPERKFVVCVSQKAGSTSWHKLVYRIRHPGSPWIKIGHSENFQAFTVLSADKKIELMKSKDVVRILQTRHPFSRLISGWEDKFLSKRMEKNKAVMLRSMPDLREYAKQYPDPFHFISFRGLVNYILQRGLKKIDVHFQSIVEHCDPCNYPYDYILKAETAAIDGWFVLNKFNGSFSPYISHAPTLGSEKIEKPVATSQTDPAVFLKQIAEYEAHKIQEAFADISKDKIKELMKLYQKDFDVFGYTFDVDTLRAGGMI